MTDDQIQALKQIAETHGFELHSISEFLDMPTLAGRYDKAPESIEELEVIQAELDALNCGLRFTALQSKGIDDITIARSIRKGYKLGQKSLKEAGF